MQDVIQNWYQFLFPPNIHLSPVFRRVVAHARKPATDTCHAVEVLILCHYETHQGNDAHEHLLYHHSCLCHNLFIFNCLYFELHSKPLPLEIARNSFGSLLA